MRHSKKITKTALNFRSADLEVTGESRAQGSTTVATPFVTVKQKKIVANGSNRSKVL